MKPSVPKKRKRKDMKSITILLAIVTAALWLVLLLIKHIVTGVDFSSLLDDILANILGILPPIILFNFLYEYLTREHVADEMTEQITQTLMSNPEAIDLFDENPKKAFVRTTIQTLVGQDECDMVYGVVEPYLEMQYNIRRFFRYNITLRDYENNPLFAPKRYLRVYEDVKYRKYYIGENALPRKFFVGFFSDNVRLDKELHEQTYLFRENLKVEPEVLDKLSAMAPQEQMQFLTQQMALSVYINDAKCVLESVEINRSGIHASFLSEHSETERVLNIEVTFNMPQLKGFSEFLVSITEPTYSPMIQFSYPEDTMNVTMFPFLNDGEECLVQNAMRNTGSCDIYLQDKWIYPMSGVVFIVEDKKCAPDANALPQAAGTD